MTKQILAPALACILLAAPAAADLTAEQVLSDQLNLLSGNGMIEARTTGTTPAPDGLAIDGYILSFTADGADHQVRIGGVELREKADGSVEVVYPETLDIRMTSDGENTDFEEAIFTLRLTGMSHIVSGDPGDITHDVAFTRAALEDIRTSPPGNVPEGLEYETAVTDTSFMIRLADSATSRREVRFDIGAMILRMALPENDPNASWEEIEELDAVIQLTGLRGEGSYLGADVPEHKLDLRLDDLLWRQSMSGDGLDAMDLSMAADDLELSYDIAISLDDFDTDLFAAMASGQRIAGQVNYASASAAIDAVTHEGPMRSVSSAGKTTSRFSFDRTGITVAMESVDNSAEMSIPASPDMPFGAFAYGIARSFVDFDFPLLPGDEAQPFRLAMALEGVEIAEDLWSLFDPGQKIPRDALNLVVDLEGSTRIVQDPFAAAPGEIPFKDTRASLKELRFNLAGVGLTATGEAEDRTHDGVPAGIGRLDMKLTGFNTLLDTLITMGLVTDDQAIPARMGLGLIARPGDEPDTLVSTIEAMEDGTIFANGQRIK